MRREQYDVDGQVVRTYFGFEAVRQGLLDVTGRLFGLEWTPVPADEAGTWHPEVASYDVGLDGRRIGRIHLDLHPREGKFKHAAQFDMVAGLGERQLPEGVLVCNFARGLMEHDEVVTLFHEFGHLVHHVLGGQGRWLRFSGVATEWDFVEAPSQMLEEWAWDADVLATFARNADGETIPAELVAAMRRADHFGKGLYAAHQMSYAARSYWFHAQAVRRPHSLRRRAAGALLGLPAAGRWAHAVRVRPPRRLRLGLLHLHVVAGHRQGPVLRLRPRRHVRAEVALAYRDKVLAMGGRKDAADLVADFLGRPYSFDSWAAWLQEE